MCVSFYFFSFSQLLAHPVIWKNGTVFTSKVSSTLNEIRSHYSFTRYWAAGMHAIEYKDTYYGMIQNNFLVHRWNELGSQTNVYAFTGFGRNVHVTSDFVLHLGIQADWENRERYAHFSVDSFFNEASFYHINARLGAAPYVGKYEDIHTWLILQFDGVIDSASHTFSITPIVRLFKGQLLVEIGSNFGGRYFFKSMVHF